MKHYEGELGIFDYDEIQFQVLIFMGAQIHYIGKETDGFRIVIPDGVIDLSETFRDSNLATPPLIPGSVVYCTNTFHNCVYLIQTAELPEGVLDTQKMYSGCDNLVYAESIPSTVTNCERMFRDCFKLKEGANYYPAPDSNRKFMYSNYMSLEKAYDMECTEQTNGMYTGYFSFQ